MVACISDESLRRIDAEHLAWGGRCQDRLRERTGAATNVEPTRIRSRRQPLDELARCAPAPSSHKRFIGVTRCPHVVLRGASRRHVSSSQPCREHYIYDLVPVEVGLRATALANTIKP